MASQAADPRLMLSSQNLQVVDQLSSTLFTEV